MTLVAQRWNNPRHGRAAGTAIQRTLENGCLGPPSGVRRAGRRHRGPHRDVVGVAGSAATGSKFGLCTVSVIDLLANRQVGHDVATARGWRVRTSVF